MNIPFFGSPLFSPFSTLSPDILQDGSLCDGACHRKGQDVEIHLIFERPGNDYELIRAPATCQDVAGHVIIISYRVLYQCMLWLT